MLAGRRQMKRAMAAAAAAAPPGCDRKDTTDLGWGKKRLTPGGETASTRRAFSSFSAAA